MFGHGNGLAGYSRLSCAGTCTLLNAKRFGDEELKWCWSFEFLTTVRIMQSGALIWRVITSEAQVGSLMSVAQVVEDRVNWKWMDFLKKEKKSYFCSKIWSYSWTKKKEELAERCVWVAAACRWWIVGSVAPLGRQLWNWSENYRSV